MYAFLLNLGSHFSSQIGTTNSVYFFNPKEMKILYGIFLFLLRLHYIKTEKTKPIT